MLKSKAYTLQYNTTINGKIITSGELVVKAKYLCYTQVDTNWYWNIHPQHHVITVTTRKISHPQLEVSAVPYFRPIPNSVFTRTLAKKAISRNSICLTDSDYD